MTGDPKEDAGFWLRPVWETEDEDDLEPPGPPRARKKPAAPDYDHPLLSPLARAQTAVARLEAKTEAASPAVVEGLRAWMSYLEAAGWMRHAYFWISPSDLALRDHGMTTSYGAAARDGRLETVLPATAAQQSDLTELVPAGAIGLDLTANRALSLARLWRRLAELLSWRPLADAEALQNTLKSLGTGGVEEAIIEDWLGGVFMRERGPDLIRAGRAALDWTNQPGVRDRSPDGFFLGACLWQEKNRVAPIPLPFWSAPEPHHHRLGLKTGVDWMVEFLECVTASSMIGLRELARLQEAEKKGRAIGSTRRSRLPDAVDAVLRSHIVTAASLARQLRVTPQAAWALLRQLAAAGMVREATGRASWRAYVLIG
jgi:DNA binding protein with HTH domain